MEPLSFATLSLRRPVAVTMALAALLVVGLIAWRAIPLEFLPSGLTPPFLFVQVPTLRAAPEDIEQRIAVPVEDVLATVSGLRRLATRIEPNSASFILQFADRADMDDAYNQVRERMERVTPGLGDDIGRYFIWKYNPADDPVIWFGATVDDTVEDPGAVISSVVVPRLERLPGVSRVDVNGAAQRAVAIEIDDVAAEAAGTDLAQLVGRLQQDNFSLALGRLPIGDQLAPLRATARWTSLDQIRSLAVGPSRVLGDIADVRIEDRADRAIYRVNQRPGIFLEVYRDSAANTVALAESVRRVLAEDVAADPRAEGMRFHFFFDQGELIEESLGQLQQSAAIGAVFAVLILALFLRHAAMTALIAIAIPLCLVFTVAAMHVSGFTLNLLTLMGLMLSVGMVVDNAIVVVESIQRRRAAGEGPTEAAANGTRSVAVAIAVSTLTTVVVFAPIVLMSGNAIISFYLAQIGFPLCAGLVASLLVALLALPLGSRVVLGGRAPEEPRWLVAIEDRYARALALALRRRADSTIVAVAVFASVVIPSAHVLSTDQSEPNFNDFRVFVNMPESAPWPERETTLLEVERTLWAVRDELGIRDMYTRMGRGRFGRPQVRVFLADVDPQGRARSEVVEQAMAMLAAPPGVTFTASWDAPTGGGRTTTVSLVGPDSRRLVGLSDEVARRLRLVPGVVGVRSEASDDGDLEAHLRVNADRLAPTGLSTALVGGIVDFAIRGRELEPVTLGDTTLPVFVRGDLARSGTLADLDRVELPGAIEGLTLGAVADVVPARGFDRIDREDGRTVVTLSIQTTGDDVQGLSRAIDAIVAEMAWPRGYGLEKGDRFAALALETRDRNFALLLAVVFVFLLMGVLLESFVLPLSVILAIPFAFAGAWWGLYVTGTSLDLMAGIGLVILVGVVVNNAIVLVDAIAEQLAVLGDRDAAIVEAGRRRLRPIAMTALTTIAGLVPMAVGDAGLVGVPYAPLGIAIIGGLTASTVLTLFVVPVFYAHFDDARRWVPARLVEVARSRTQA
jgi:HAE1 family hydrophobic/amphiphilic exporter-1